MNKIKQFLLLLCAFAVIGAIPVVLSRREVIPTDMPALSRAEIVANKQEYESRKPSRKRKSAPAVLPRPAPPTLPARPTKTVLLWIKTRAAVW